jgi:lipoate-protein ligase B
LAHIFWLARLCATTPLLVSVIYTHEKYIHSERERLGCGKPIKFEQRISSIGIELFNWLTGHGIATNFNDSVCILLTTMLHAAHTCSSQK